METDQSTYRTVDRGGSVTLMIGGSKFIATISSADSITRAETFIENVQEEYSDATHHVPAYRIRADPFREWANDNGEPAGSAGKPILNVLTGERLENVVVVVTRYFGGTKLGYGGLVGAYSDATKAVIDAVDIVVERPHDIIHLQSAYDDSGTVRRILESERVEFDAEYSETVTFMVRVPTADRVALMSRIKNATAGRIEGAEHD